MATSPSNTAMRIIASSPGDIVAEFKVPETGKFYVVPLKSVSSSKNMDVSPEYALGSHQAYAMVVGKIAYEGDFQIGTWYCSDEAQPAVWDQWVTLLTYQTDEGLPREFTINIHARSGDGMKRVGTGTYGNMGGAYTGSTGEDASDLVDYINNSSATGNSTEYADTVIMSFHRCILKGDSFDVPEVGGTTTRRYPFACMFRSPK